MQYPQSMYIV